MIDIENDVFNFVYPYVEEIVPMGAFTSEYVHAPAAFPCATLMEMDNFTDMKLRTTADEEDFATLTYEANAYAMNKRDCRAVMAGIDKGMTDLGFTRMSMQFTPNLEDSRVYRITARFQANANRAKTIFRKM